MKLSKLTGIVLTLHV